jgi:hypothetical protein
MSVRSTVSEAGTFSTWVALQIVRTNADWAMPGPSRVRSQAAPLFLGRTPPDLRLARDFSIFPRIDLPEPMRCGSIQASGGRKPPVLTQQGAYAPARQNQQETSHDQSCPNRVSL